MWRGTLEEDRHVHNPLKTHKPIGPETDKEENTGLLLGMSFVPVSMQLALMCLLFSVRGLEASACVSMDL